MHTQCDIGMQASISFPLCGGLRLDLHNRGNVLLCFQHNEPAGLLASVIINWKEIEAIVGISLLGSIINRLRVMI